MPYINIDGLIQAIQRNAITTIDFSPVRGSELLLKDQDIQALAEALFNNRSVREIRWGNVLMSEEMLTLLMEILSLPNRPITHAVLYRKYPDLAHRYVALMLAPLDYIRLPAIPGMSYTPGTICYEDYQENVFPDINYIAQYAVTKFYSRFWDAIKSGLKETMLGMEPGKEKLRVAAKKSYRAKGEPFSELNFTKIYYKQTFAVYDPAFARHYYDLDQANRNRAALQRHPAYRYYASPLLDAPEALPATDTSKQTDVSPEVVAALVEQITVHHNLEVLIELFKDTRLLTRYIVHGRTPFHAACELGSKEVLLYIHKLLLGLGDDAPVTYFNIIQLPKPEGWHPTTLLQMRIVEKPQELEMFLIEIANSDFATPAPIQQTSARTPMCSITAVAPVPSAPLYEGGSPAHSDSSGSEHGSPPRVYSSGSSSGGSSGTERMSKIPSRMFAQASVPVSESQLKRKGKEEPSDVAARFDEIIADLKAGLQASFK